jgi:hypothetical protein
MQLDRQSGVILSFPQAPRPRAVSQASGTHLDAGRLANLALLSVVLALAALWLAFPPPQLSASPGARTTLAQDLPVGNAGR